VRIGAWATRLAIVGGALAMVSVGSPGAAEDNGPIQIGVPVPLTGNLAQSGQLVLNGVQVAADEINQNGGLLGRPVKLLIEDTKGEANTSAAVGAKLVTEDKVFALVGGFGSTPDFALLQSIKRYEPIFMHAASQSVKLEKAFGGQPWYFHTYLWEYVRQQATAKFLSSLQPKPKTVAITYEDGLFGNDAAHYAQSYMKEPDLDVVVSEPFRTGSPDFSPVLSRVKSANPDILFIIGYPGDEIQIARQIKQLDIKPKLVLYTDTGAARADLGDAVIGATMVMDYSPDQKTPGNAELVKRMSAAYPNQPFSSMMLGYTGLKTLADAVKIANSFDKAKVIEALSNNAFDTPFGHLAYAKSPNGAIHSLLSEETEIVVQFRKDGMDVIWPDGKANGKLIYPAE
jgi:branched-chain amino acid transport system substrate-binding protein